MADRKKRGPDKKVSPAPKAAKRKKAPAKAKKKSVQKKGPKKGQLKDGVNLPQELKRIFLGIAVLASVCLTIAMVADIYFNSGKSDRHGTTAVVKKSTHSVLSSNRDAPVARPDPKESVLPEEPESTAPPGVENKHKLAGLKAKPDHPILYEVFEDVDHSHAPKIPADPGDKTPRIALIIDDIGYDRNLAMALFDLDHNITLSVLPWSPFGRSLSKRLSAKGAQLMLHLPMEPMEYPKVNPGPGALLASMPPDVLLEQLGKNLSEITGVAGVNNHMGSRLTSQSSQMNQIFTILKKQDLFFIDSRTSKDSQCRPSARLLRIEFAQRDIFLDNVQDTAYIAKQLSRLVRLAKKHGSAIGIGHPYKATLHALAKELPKLKGKVHIVPAGQLVHIPG